MIPYRTMSHPERPGNYGRQVHSTLMRALLQRLGKMEGATILSPDPCMVDSEKHFTVAIWARPLLPELEGKWRRHNKYAQWGCLKSWQVGFGRRSQHFPFSGLLFQVYAIYAAYTDEELKAEGKENETEKERNGGNLLFTAQ
ncbi:MAG: hypothetical protein H6558_15530 [Lewinellaceae bacterium]|nr:hypothetical protein [Lewinellaceae bacterium]